MVGQEWRVSVQHRGARSVLAANTDNNMNYPISFPPPEDIPNPVPHVHGEVALEGRAGTAPVGASLLLGRRKWGLN